MSGIVRTNARPLILLPGIGADGRLFEAQRAVRDIRVIDWIEPARGESLEDYAARLASTVTISEPFDLGGASFGGMVALELARHLKPERVFLFGSCRTPNAIALSLRALRFLPVVRPPRIAALWFGARSRQHIDLFADMLARTPLDFIRWASAAIFSWAGVEGLAMPVVHVHGARDRIIPLRRVRPDHVIAGAGHLLNLTHAAAVNALLSP